MPIYCRSVTTRHGSIIQFVCVSGSLYSARFILFGSGPLDTDRLYGFLCVTRCASNCLAKVFKSLVVRRSIFGGIRSDG